MKNLLIASQMKAVDAHTITHLSIKSIELMERAATAFAKRFSGKFKNRNLKIAVFCGRGNNGGDGLAIARLLNDNGYRNVKVYLVNFSSKQSDNYLENLKKLRKSALEIIDINTEDGLNFSKVDVVIDAIFGSGLDKRLAGNYPALIHKINDSSAKIVSVDIPTGLRTEGEIDLDYNGIKADLTISFQQPKINFFFPESIIAQKHFEVVDIGLDEGFIQKQVSAWKLTTKKDIKRLIKPRENFSHKGTYGHALIVVGNHATMGAAILSTMGCLKAGTGLTTVCVPEDGFFALNATLPEAMTLARSENIAAENVKKFNAIAIGPGLGTGKDSESLLENIVKSQRPLILDADALNIFGRRKDWLNELPKETILTPHIKEFDRLFGDHKSWWSRVATAIKIAREFNFVIVLKNQYTFVCLPTGEVHINATGNPAMASGGMGDVLTGIITGFKAQGYSSADAAILGVYLHGKAGDELAKKRFSVTASDVANRIPKTVKNVLK